MNIPIWDQRGKNGIGKIPTITKVQIELGILLIN